MRLDHLLSKERKKTRHFLSYCALIVVTHTEDYIGREGEEFEERD